MTAAHRSPLRIFLSHTAELAEAPMPRSFVAGARSAVERAGHTVVDMASWSAADIPSSELCAARVGRCDVYVGILGFRYGSVVRDLPSKSYVELEFDAATACRIPRLVFVLAEALDVAVPHSFHVDPNADRQEAFKATVTANGLVYARVTSPTDLEIKLFQSLLELNPPDRPGNVTPPRRPYMAPPRMESYVPRQALMRLLHDALLTADNQAVALTTALQGAGGFGKTTLASEACRDPMIVARFPDGVLWTTIGEALAGADLAGKINDLCEALSGARPTFTDPEQAGFYLGSLLGSARRLLVVDDVWHSSQLQPFLSGGAGCVRLITTRNRSIVPDSAHPITVDAMEGEEASNLLGHGLSGMDERRADTLLRATGRWPVLVSLVNAALRRHVRDGGDVNTAADSVAGRLHRKGPTALDVTRPELRRQAVSATLDASLSMLAPEQLTRYLELGIFAEDARIPLSAIAVLWEATGSLDDDGVELLCHELADLSLVTCSRIPTPAVEIHDVVRSFIRQRISERLEWVNRQWLDAVAATLPRDGHDAGTPWWALPKTHYLWDALGFHLFEAGRSAELQRLVKDLRWVSAKLLCRSPAALDADFALAGADPVAATLRRLIGQSSHLLGAIEPDHSIISILLSRLDNDDSRWYGVDFIASLHHPRLESLWRLADRPDPAMRRAMTGHVGMIWTCSVDPSGHFLVSADDCGRLRVWDPLSGALRYQVDASAGAIYTCCISPDRTWIATGGQDGVVRLWDLETGAHLRDLDGGAGTVYGSSVDATGQRLAVCGVDGVVNVWEVDRCDVAARLQAGRETLYDCVFGPHDGQLTTVGQQGILRIWRLGADRPLAELDGATGSLYACVVDRAGDWIAAAGYDGVLRLWSATTLQQRAELPAGAGAVYDCCASSDGRWIGTVSEDRVARIWDPAAGELRGEFEGHTGYLGSCAAAPDGSWLVSAGNDRSLRIWDTSNHFQDSSATRSRVPVLACATAGDGTILVTALQDGEIQLRDPLSGQVLNAFGEAGSAVEGVSISFDGATVAAVGAGGHLRLWRTGTGQLLRHVDAHRRWALSCSFEPHGKAVATGGIDGRVGLWDVTSGALIREMRGHRRAVVCCAVSPDGRMVAACGYDRVAIVWDLANGQVVQTLRGSSSWLFSCSWSLDASSLFAAGEDGATYAWDVTSGELRQVFLRHSGAVRACAVDACGNLLATCGDDDIVRIWDTNTGSCLVAMRVEADLRTLAWLGTSTDVLVGGQIGTYLFRYHDATRDASAGNSARPPTRR
jgi:WD40 repeat protein